MVMAAIAAFMWVGGAREARTADPRSKLPAVQTPIDAANIPPSFVLVEGTVTVRVRGVRVSPGDVTYAFDPPFKLSTGFLSPISEGTYRFHLNKVPADGAYTLTIKAAYNDTIISGGVVQRKGSTVTGSIRIAIPYGRDYSFGDQLLDLN